MTAQHCVVCKRPIEEPLALCPSCSLALSALQDKVLAHVLPATVPLYGIRRGGDGAPIVAGTGLLLRIGDTRLLVTAAHVLMRAIHNKFALATAGLPPAPVVVLSGPLRNANGESLLLQEPYDVAVMPLSEALTDKISVGRRFIALDEVESRSGLANDGPYAVVGFPDDIRETLRQERQVRATPLIYMGALNRNEDRQLKDFDSQRHLGIRLELDSTAGGDGRRITPPEPHGMSGCGMWQVVDRSQKTLSVRLVGIQSKLNRAASTLWGARADALFALIYKRMPELRAPIAAYRTSIFGF